MDFSREPASRVLGSRVLCSLVLGASDLTTLRLPQVFYSATFRSAFSHEDLMDIMERRSPDRLFQVKVYDTSGRVYHVNLSYRDGAWVLSGDNWHTLVVDNRLNVRTRITLLWFHEPFRGTTWKTVTRLVVVRSHTYRTENMARRATCSECRRHLMHELAM